MAKKKKTKQTNPPKKTKTKRKTKALIETLLENRMLTGSLSISSQTYSLMTKRKGYFDNRGIWQIAP